MTTETKTFTDSQGNTYLATREPMHFHTLNISYTASGYGPKIPSEWVITDEGRRKRIYVAIYSNIGTTYFMRGGQKVTVS